MAILFPRNKYGDIAWHLDNGEHITTQAERDGWECRRKQDRKVSKAQSEWRDALVKARKAAKVGIINQKARAWRAKYVGQYPCPFPGYWEHRHKEREAWAAMKEGRAWDENGTTTPYNKQ